MSEFYGFVQGNRGPATKGGSKASGIAAAAQSWDGSVSVELFYKDGQIHCRIHAGPGSTSNPGYCLYYGPLSDLVNGSVDLVLAKVGS